MPTSIHAPGRWLLRASVMLGILICGGLYRCWYWSFPNDLRLGLDAYARGDWRAASNLARDRLKDAHDDIPALQLLARSSVKLELDASALLLYQRLGPEVMSADDYYLVDVALRRTGNQRGVMVWEQGLQKDPEHPEILDALARVYFSRARYSDAASLARRLVQYPAWKPSASRLLGDIEFAQNNYVDAIHWWQTSIKEASTEESYHTSVQADTHKNLARALLHLGRSAEASSHLQLVLAKSPDAEVSWLLSRVYLQEHALPEALAALKKASPFVEDDPTRPDPAPYTGSASCSSCHSEKYQSQQSSRHARTFHHGAELRDLQPLQGTIIDPFEARVTHTFRRSGDRLEQETHTPERLYRVIVDYAFGSGDRGKTLIGHDPSGQAFELRLSIYREKAEQTSWDVTSGHHPRPPISQDYLGLTLTEEAVRRCFSCHVTNPKAVLTSTGPEAMDHSIGCEKCHGPAGNHLIAVTTRFPDLAIARPSLTSGEQVVRICAQCHSPSMKTVEPDDPTSVRFQGTTLTWSRCYTESKNRLDCVTCHDPHRNVVTSKVIYEAKCLACHSGQSSKTDVARGHLRRRFELSEIEHAPSCPVNATTGCISCHMPKVKDVIPHSPFTDHFIRVHREQTNRAGS